MTTHAKLSPSGASRWMNCPGCIKLGENIESTSSVYAMDGSIAHDLGCLCLLKGHDPERYLNYWGWYNANNATGIVQDKPDDHPDLLRVIPVDEAMVEAVTVYVDEVRRARGLLSRAKFWTEEKLYATWLDKDLFGTGDHVAREPLGRVWVHDYKNGVNLVEVKDNPQFKIYALGAVGEGNPTMAETVIMTVVQPNAIHPDGPVRHDEISVDDLLYWGNSVLRPAAQKCHQGIKDYDTMGCVAWREAYLHPGKWCKWCPVEATCQANNAAQAKDMFGRPNLPVETNSVLPDISLMPPEEIFRIIAVIPRFKDFIKAVENEGYQYLDRNGAAFGYKLIQGYGYRKYTDESAAADVLFQYMDRDEMFETKLRSPAQIEKVLTKKHIKPAERKAIVDPLVITPLTQKKMVPEDHKAPALPPSAEAMFGTAN